LSELQELYWDTYYLVQRSKQSTGAQHLCVFEKLRDHKDSMARPAKKTQHNPKNDDGNPPRTDQVIKD
jgi:hypothetical protein